MKNERGSTGTFTTCCRRSDAYFFLPGTTDRTLSEEIELASFFGIFGCLGLRASRLPFRLAICVPRSSLNALSPDAQNVLTAKRFKWS